VKQKDDGIFISQDKYVADILKKFDFVIVKTASTPIETNKALIKDEESEGVDVHLYRSMIGSFMYLKASRPGIMFAVCACARFQVTLKVSHLHAMKRIFRYLKGQPKLGLWYPMNLPFDLEDFSNSDYARASLDRKSTTGGCQFLGKRQVLWIQNPMLDYGFNFMNTKIHIDNKSTICIVKNLVFHSKTKHIEIRNHFIRDSYEKRLIHVIKNHTDHNVADLLIKAFDVSRVSVRDEFGNKTGSCRLMLLGSTLENGDMEITATIDGKVKIVSEASIRRHLKLEDSDGISTLPNTEIFEQLALMGGVAPSTSQPHHSPTLRDFIRQETEVPQPSSPTQTHVADKAASTGVDVSHGGAATTISSLDVGHGSGNIDKTPVMPYDSPLPRVYTHGNDEGRMQHNELMDLVTKLLDRVVSLETDLQQTKKVYGAAYTKLIKKVKRLEDKLNKSRRKHKLMGAQTRGRHDHEMEVDFEFTTTEDVSTANVSVNTAGTEISNASPKVKIVGVSIDDVVVEGLVYIRRSAAKIKDKGKAIMEKSEPTQTKTKLQQEQERLGFEEALRLQEQIDKEERQRIVSVHEEASTLKPEE
ncbi:hypothetical protein Tco_1159104, partial [Tanacetum coccineum]